MFAARTDGASAGTSRGPRLPGGSGAGGKMRTRWRFGAAAVTLALLPASAAAVTYILYYHTFGDWAVVCWRGMAAGEQSCFMNAPPIAFNTDPFTSDIKIEPVGKEIELAVSARSGMRTGTKVRLLVDGRSVAESMSDRIDHAIFSGAEAQAILQALQTGRRLVIDLPDAKRQIEMSLKDFGNAYAAFQENLAYFTSAAARQPTTQIPAPAGPAAGGGN